VQAGWALLRSRNTAARSREIRRRRSRRAHRYGRPARRRRAGSRRPQPTCRRARTGRGGKRSLRTRPGARGRRNLDGQAPAVVRLTSSSSASAETALGGRGDVPGRVLRRSGTEGQLALCFSLLAGRIRRRVENRRRLADRSGHCLRRGPCRELNDRAGRRVFSARRRPDLDPARQRIEAALQRPIAIVSREVMTVAPAARRERASTLLCAPRSARAHSRIDLRVRYSQAEVARYVAGLAAADRPPQPAKVVGACLGR
jgi:hypothetical protein